MQCGCNFIFGIVQKLYVFFSPSTDRWKVLLQFLPKLTLKRVCDTRWESRIDAIRPIRHQFGEIYDALLHIKEDLNLTGSHGLQTKSDACDLLKNICDFKFISSVIVWYDILSAVNPISKQLQSIHYDIQMVLKSVSSIVKFLKEYRQNGFPKVKIAAKEIALLIEIPGQFPEEYQIRKRQKKTHFSYENRDETPLHNPEKKFEVEFFHAIMDTAINSLRERFNLLKNWEHETLLNHCKDLAILLSAKETSDINAVEQFEELKIFCQLTEPNSSPNKNLELIYNKKLQEIYPNITISLRIVLTIPVTVASAKRSFSKLKPIKNHLRSTMSNERLTGLALLSIESDLAQELDLEDIVQDFASKKARKVNF
jgi:hypothetical protein